MAFIVIQRAGDEHRVGLSFAQVADDLSVAAFFQHFDFDAFRVERADQVFGEGEQRRGGLETDGRLGQDMTTQQDDGAGEESSEGFHSDEKRHLRRREAKP